MAVPVAIADRETLDSVTPAAVLHLPSRKTKTAYLATAKPWADSESPDVLDNFASWSAVEEGFWQRYDAGTAEADLVLYEHFRRTGEVPESRPYHRSQLMVENMVVDPFWADLNLPLNFTRRALPDAGGHAKTAVLVKQLTNAQLRVFTKEFRIERIGFLKVEFLPGPVLSALQSHCDAGNPVGAELALLETFETTKTRFTLGKARYFYRATTLQPGCSYRSFFSIIDGYVEKFRKQQAPADRVTIAGHFEEIRSKFEIAMDMTCDDIFRRYETSLTEERATDVVFRRFQRDVVDYQTRKYPAHTRRPHEAPPEPGASDPDDHDEPSALPMAPSQHKPPLAPAGGPSSEGTAFNFNFNFN